MSETLQARLDAMVRERNRVAFFFNLPADTSPPPSSSSAAELYYVLHGVALDLLSRLDAAEAQVKALTAERDELVSTIKWALGEEGEFPERPEKVEGKPHPLYWWRSELRARAALKLDEGRG